MPQRAKKRVLKAFVAFARRTPWWVSLALALALYALLHAIALSTLGDFRQAGFTRYAAKSIKTVASLAQYLLPALMLMTAGFSLFRPKRRDSAAQWRPSAELASMSWSEFQRLTAEALRRQEYRLEEAGKRFEGIDLLLKRYGQSYLVQCKHWHAWNVSVQQVRDFHERILAHGAAGGFFVTSGRFTSEAVKYAEARKIQLIDGIDLLKIVPLPRTTNSDGIDQAMACGQRA